MTRQVAGNGLTDRGSSPLSWRAADWHRETITRFGWVGDFAGYRVSPCADKRIALRLGKY